MGLNQREELVFSDFTVYFKITQKVCKLLRKYINCRVVLYKDYNTMKKFPRPPVSTLVDVQLICLFFCVTLSHPRHSNKSDLQVHSRRGLEWIVRPHYSLFYGIYGDSWKNHKTKWYFVVTDTFFHHFMYINTSVTYALIKKVIFFSWQTNAHFVLIDISSSSSSSECSSLD